MGLVRQSTDLGPLTFGEGRFIVSRPVGSGGHSQVFMGIDTHQDDRVVALKVLRSRVENRRDRFRRESRWQLEHSSPYVVPVYAMGSEESCDWVAMEYCPAGSLNDVMAQNGPLDGVAACAATLQILKGLAFAHDNGLVHRDIKPGNLLVGRDGKLRLTDFGIALHRALDRQTETGMSLCTLAYAAPEQRLDPRDATARSDIYSVGSTLYRLLTAKNPMDLFTAESDSERFEGIELPLVDVLRQATHFDPAERYADTDAMARAILDVVAEIAPDHHDRLVRSWEGNPPVFDQRRLLPTVGIGVVLGVAALATIVQLALL